MLRFGNPTVSYAVPLYPVPLYLCTPLGYGDAKESERGTGVIAEGERGIALLLTYDFLITYSEGNQILYFMEILAFIQQTKRKLCYQVLEIRDF